MNDTTNATGCRWVSSTQPRVVPGRHGYGCNNEACPGCQPCERSHCRVCGKEHAVGSCPGCLDDIRSDIAEIVRMCGDLPDEVENRGVDGEAMVLLGPVADPEARGHWRASVEAGRIVPPDCDARELVDVKAWLDKADHERHPLTVLGTWQMLVEDARESDESAPVSVAGAAAYLGRHLNWIGASEWLPVDDLARDLRGSRTHMERVLHDGEQVEAGAPCPHCGANLRHTYGKRMVDDTWTCPRRGCGLSYTTTQYRGWVEEDARNQADRLTAADMALRFTDEEMTLKPTTVRVWGSRGLVRKRGHDQNGMTLYDVADVESRLIDAAESA